jgi:nucleotide-binding universal stress UspA family protein
MKILVPTDFSDLSNEALNYAVEIAKKTKSSIHLHHNAMYEGPPTAGVFVNLSQKVVQMAEKDLNEFAANLRESTNHEIDISWEVTSYNSHEKAINQTASKSGSSVIIMGSKGKSGLEGAIIGHIAYQTLQASEFPTLVVPPNCKFKNNGHAVFAIDVNNVPNDESLKALNRSLNLINYCLDLLFINVKGDEPEIFQVKDTINNNCNSLDIEVYYEPEADVSEAIENFITKHNSDMVILHPGHHTFFEKMMGKSITKKILNQSNIPVLGIP